MTDEPESTYRAIRAAMQPFHNRVLAREPNAPQFYWGKTERERDGYIASFLQAHELAEYIPLMETLHFIQPKPG